MTKKPASKGDFSGDEDSWEFQRPENWPQHLEDLEWKASRRPQPTRAQVAWTIFVAAAVALLGVAQVMAPRPSNQILLGAADREPSGAPPWLGENSGVSDFFDRVDVRREAWKEWRQRERSTEMDRQIAAAVSAEIAQIAAFGRELLDQEGPARAEGASEISLVNFPDKRHRTPRPVPGLPRPADPR